jgi:ABC-type transporter Mla subunit MlaD
VNFGFNPPDPDKVLQSIDNLKNAFLRAADAQTGPAKPLFESLSDKFNSVVEKSMDLGASADTPDINKLMRQMMPAMMDIQSTVNQIRRQAASNPAAAQTLHQLEDDIRTEISNMLGGALPGIPGLPSIKKTPPKPPAPPKGPKPKRPGDGSFDL